jgi:hypothetical protein
MSQAPHAWQDNADRDYQFAKDVVRARAAETSDVKNGLVSDVVAALLGCVKAQRQGPTIKSDTVPLRNEALRLMSFLHAELVDDKIFLTAVSADREAHVWMTAVGLYDEFLCRDVSMRHCHQHFVLACYSIAFKYEENYATISHARLLGSLYRYSEQTKTPRPPWCFGAAYPGRVCDAELIVLKVVQWKVPMEGTLIHIDNLLVHADAWSKTSALLIRAYDLATDISMDWKMLSAATYSPFYTACTCVQQACNELQIPTERIFGNHEKLSWTKDAAVSGCV